jgi:hypothetical protein
MILIILCEGKSKITMVEKKWFCEDWKLIKKFWEKERNVKVKMFCLLSFNISFKMDPTLTCIIMIAYKIRIMRASTMVLPIFQYLNGPHVYTS